MVTITQVPLPEGYTTATELYMNTHAEIGLLLSDFKLGVSTAEETITKICEAREEAVKYTTALYENGLL